MADRRRTRLDQPVVGRTFMPRPFYDAESFGRLSETIARFMGTARFIVIQTVIVVVWIGLNVAASALRWDPYPFILLNLAFSTQAAYAAPLILLAQNRQAERDRVALEEDRARAERAVADTEFLARELAGMRMSIGEVATRDFLRDQLRDLTEEVVARTTEGVYDRQARMDREERERRAERKKRQKAPDTTGLLSEPFRGDTDPG